MAVPSTVRSTGSIVKATPSSDQPGVELIEIVKEAVVGPESV
jgi:hypothetical protein